ncbi:MAG: hypothetical protein EOP08_02230 [Proteobacteria bacterium]|nr:MAG: hypothetical protein EOP08_02230 [Pseudomonadota bacterium]
MRRDSEGVLAPPEFLPPSLRGLDPALVIEALEPHVGDDRKERLYAVLKQRLASLTVLFDAPYDPHNGAAVIRSCDAFGVGRLHVVERQKSFLFATCGSAPAHLDAVVEIVGHLERFGTAQYLAQRQREELAIRACIAHGSRGELAVEQLLELGLDLRGRASSRGRVAVEPPRDPARKPAYDVDRDQEPQIS